MSAKVNKTFESCNTAMPEHGGHVRANNGSLDTLVQLGTTNMHTCCVPSPSEDKLSLQNTTTKHDKKNLQKRARRKYLTNGMAVGLVRASEENPNSVLRKGYWRSYHCTASLQLRENGHITAEYCNCRWCMVCNAIRTAKYINKYNPIITNWENAHFVTLTEKNCKASELRARIDSMQGIFKAIMENQKRKFQRGNSNFRLVGIRKLECTYNAVRDDYNPHFHVIMESKEMGAVLRSEWLKRNDLAKAGGQDMRPVDSKACMELFKYMTKVVSGNAKTGRSIYVDALDIIFNAIHRKRTIQPFGFKAGKLSVEDEGENIDAGHVLAVMRWHQEVTDWVDAETQELFTGYTPGDGMRDLVENKVRFARKKD